MDNSSKQHLCVGGPADGRRIVTMSDRVEFSEQPEFILGLVDPDLPIEHPKTTQYYKERIVFGAKEYVVFISDDFHIQDLFGMLLEKYPEPKKDKLPEPDPAELVAKLINISQQMKSFTPRLKPSMN